MSGAPGLTNDVSAYATVVDGVCNYQVISSGNSPTEVQLAQWGFPLMQGHSLQAIF